ncbi:hypothetical protein VNI00_002962 [Paramarasmius palmivorus]|uniref:Uncharacterized protein n=1 Tax=Paramarasmius palmivorus TaxID=297713 RepID=A0AAW0DWK9_9AGAR
MPWASVAESEPSIRVPECVNTSDDHRDALFTARRRRETSPAIVARKDPPSEPCRPPPRRATRHGSSSFRDALVFEREITLDTGNEKKRWSLHVPASTMNPEMVDMMLELQHLRSFFKEDPEEEDDTAMIPPSLMVSNSHFTLPLSLPSTESVESSPPATLAVRRGNRPLPPLLSSNSGVFEPLESSPYSDIPTAFLGTPSYDSSSLQATIPIHRPSANFNDMVYDLRSRCEPLQTRPSIRFPSIQEDMQELATKALSPSRTADSDEWGFAQSIMQKYGNTFSIINPVVTPDASADELDLTPDSIDYTLVSSPLTTVTPPFKGLDDSASMTTPDHSFSLENRASSLTHSICDSTGPTTASPTPSVRSSSPSGGPVNPSPRGILKRCKSVRFAESPIENEPPVISKEVAVGQPTLRHSLGSAHPKHKLLKRPSPLRSTFTPQSNHVTSLSRSTPSEPQTVPSLRAAGRQKSPATYGNVVTKPPRSSNRSASAACDKGAPGSALSSPIRSSTIMTRGRNGVNSKQTPVAKLDFSTPMASSSPPRPTTRTKVTPTRARALTIPAVKDIEKDKKVVEVDKEKENKPAPKTRASLSATYTGNRAMNENAIRRGSVGSGEGQGSSRIRVPLRKIFTRFK